MDHKLIETQCMLYLWSLSLNTNIYQITICFIINFTVKITKMCLFQFYLKHTKEICFPLTFEIYIAIEQLVLASN